MTTKYTFTFCLEKKLSHEELNDLEYALWAQCEDFGCEPAQLIEAPAEPKYREQSLSQLEKQDLLRIMDRAIDFWHARQDIPTIEQLADLKRAVEKNQMLDIKDYLLLSRLVCNFCSGGNYV